MEIVKTLSVVDSHTMGESTRIITGGIPFIPGNTMLEKKNYFKDNLDYIRKMVLHEPRGHMNMFGAIITSPTTEDADLGVIFMDSGGYLNMCGHGSIGVATVAVSTGMVNMQQPYTQVVLETPAGLIKAKVKVENGKIQEVSIINVPSFLYKNNIKIDIPSIGKVSVDICFGGSFFGIVDAKQLGTKVKVENVQKLINIGLDIRNILNKTIKVRHPQNPHINTVDLVEIYDRPTHPKANLKNVVIFGLGQFDRSPCGTGTSAKLANLYSKNKISLNEIFTYESITGTIFRGKILEETMVGTYKSIIPQITGSAYITGFGQLIAQKDDPFKYGFVV